MFNILVLLTLMESLVNTLDSSSLALRTVDNLNNTDNIQDEQQYDKAKGKAKEKLLVTTAPGLEMTSEFLDANHLSELLA